MKYFAILLVLLSASAIATAAEPWLNAPDAALSAKAKVRAHVSPKNIFEVPTSRFSGAEVMLGKEPAIPLEEGALRSLSAGHFQCIYPEKPYLVRAVYENGSTGAFLAERLDDALWVAHASLGRATGSHRSALLVCLSFKPTRVFVSTSGAL